MRYADEGAILAAAADNEAAVAASSLDAVVSAWRGGAPRPAAEQVVALLAEVRPVMDAGDFAVCAGAVRAVLADGNPAQQWLARCAAGATVPEVIAQVIRDTEQDEDAYLRGCEME